MKEGGMDRRELLRKALRGAGGAAAAAVGLGEEDAEAKRRTHRAHAKRSIGRQPDLSESTRDMVDHFSRDFVGFIARLDERLQPERLRYDPWVNLKINVYVQNFARAHKADPEKHSRVIDRSAIEAAFVRVTEIEGEDARAGTILAYRVLDLHRAQQDLAETSDAGKHR